MSKSRVGIRRPETYLVILTFIDVCLLPGHVCVLTADTVHGAVPVPTEGQEPHVHQADPLHLLQLHQVSRRSATDRFSSSPFVLGLSVLPGWPECSVLFPYRDANLPWNHGIPYFPPKKKRFLRSV